MRWFSSLTILIYLSLLCSPQALAVHDSRLSPLADTQLQGLNPAINSALNQKSLAPVADDNEPPVGLMPALNPQCSAGTCNPQFVADYLVVTAIFSAHPARAPPILFSL